MESRCSMCLPHATSKITTLEDIYNNNNNNNTKNGGGFTYLGFRGEALYSLANLSHKVVVATRCAEEESAQKLEFRTDGTCDANSIQTIPRKVGTTVAVVKLLDKLPVRRRDLEQRIHSYYRAKLIADMTAYAIFRTGVRIHLMDIIEPQGQEKTILANSFQNGTLRDTVSAVLGPKFLASMTDFVVDLTDLYDSETATTDNDINDAGKLSSSSLSGTTTTGCWTARGLISSLAPCGATAGNKPATTGQQYYAIHQRPVELPKLSRLLNKSFKQYSDRTVSVILEFTIPQNQYDINLSPDKKTVLLKRQDEILERIQTVAVDVWSSQTDGRFIVENATAQPLRRRYAFVHDPSSAIAKEQEEHIKRTQFETTNAVTDSHVISRTRLDEDEQPTTELDERKRPASDEPSSIVTKRRTVSDFTAQTSQYDDLTPPGQMSPLAIGSSFAVTTWKEKKKWREAQIRFNSHDEENDDDPIQLRQTISKNKRRFGLDRFGFTTTTATRSDRSRVVSADNAVVRQTQSEQAMMAPAKRLEDNDEDVTRYATTSPTTMDEGTIKARNVSMEKVVVDDAVMVDDFGETLPSRSSDLSTATSRVSPPSRSKLLRIRTSSNNNSLPGAIRSNDLWGDSPQKAEVEADGDGVETSLVQESLNHTTTPMAVQTRKVSLVQTFVESKWSHFGSTDDVMTSYRSERLALYTRKRKLKELKSSEKPEDKTSNASIQLRKEEFRSMRVIGQFNMGFILAMDSGGNIWILDQHACDEKHNFEKLCAETTINEQRLMAPLPLDLSSLQEACILDNVNIFEKNGFRFQYDESKSPGKRCALTALPHSGAQNGRNAVQYGKDDALALCAILMGQEVDGGTGTDGSGLYGNNAIRRYATSSQHHSQVDTIMARLPKTIAMFASRACRTSLMIGTALSYKEMEKLVCRLADIEQPWNCPHGRPTLQHVRQLCSVLLEDEKRTEALIAEPTVTVLSQEDGEDDI